jgi:hypothetical protein
MHSQINAGTCQGYQIGRNFAFWAIVKICLCFENYITSAKFLATFFHGTNTVLILAKYGLGYILGDFFTNSSGHPGTCVGILFTYVRCRKTFFTVPTQDSLHHRIKCNGLMASLIDFRPIYYNSRFILRSIFQAMIFSLISFQLNLFCTVIHSTRSSSML